MKHVPHEFVLEALADLEPHTKPMFGFVGVYIGEKMVLVLAERENSPKDNGIWLATFIEFHAGLKQELPSMRSLTTFGGDGPTNWQVIPTSSPTFEEESLRACEMILANDPRIGKIPKKKLRAGAKKKSPKKSKSKKKAKARRS